MKTLHALTAALVVAGTLSAADWPQFLGPKRDGHSAEVGLLKVWPKGGPKLDWSIKTLGVGYSSPTVVGDRIYILGTREDDEYLFALDLKGVEVWKLKIGPVFDFNGNQWGKGPRSSASVSDGMVFAMGGFGDLVCADARTGALIWKKSVPKDLKGEVNPIQNKPDNLAWGYCWSPLIDGDKLICTAGGPQGTFAALDVKKGDVLWRSKDLKVQGSYSSPIVIEHDGVRQYVVLTNEGLHSVDAKTGKHLWSYDKKPGYSDVVICTPLYIDGHIYCSVGWGSTGCDLVELTKDGPKKVYGSNKTMKCKQGGVVLVGKHLYGYSDSRGWVCQDWKTGKPAWSEKDLGDGSVIVADGMLYLYTEDDGKVALVEPTPKGWTLKSSFSLPMKTTMKQPGGKNWTPPVIADGHLYLRDQEYLFRYKIK